MLNVPLWGYEDDADALADAIEAANGVFVAQVVSEPGAPGHRFVAAVISRLRTQGFTVVHAVADDATSIRPGALDAEIEQGQSSTERLAVVVESAHLADSMSLGRLLSRSVGAAKPALLIERQGGSRCGSPSVLEHHDRRHESRVLPGGISGSSDG